MRTRLIVWAWAGVIALGVGCTGAKLPPTSGKAIASLELQVQQLKSSLQGAEAARDSATEKFRKLELAHADLSQKFNKLTATQTATLKERDKTQHELAERTAQLATRTAEKEQLAGHLDVFRKNLRELLGQVESAASPPSATGSVSVAR